MKKDEEKTVTGSTEKDGSTKSEDRRSFFQCWKDKDDIKRAKLLIWSDIFFVSIIVLGYLSLAANQFIVAAHITILVSFIMRLIFTRRKMKTYNKKIMWEENLVSFFLASATSIIAFFVSGINGYAVVVIAWALVYWFVVRWLVNRSFEQKIDKVQFIPNWVQFSIIVGVGAVSIFISDDLFTDYANKKYANKFVYEAQIAEVEQIDGSFFLGKPNSITYLITLKKPVQIEYKKMMQEKIVYKVDVLGDGDFVSKMPMPNDSIMFGLANPKFGLYNSVVVFQNKRLQKKKS